jgi:hypothetical protein
VKSNCCLQINLAPNDYAHAVHILPRQLKALADQVDEIVLTLDSRQSKGRFGQNWEENLIHIRSLIEQVKNENNKIRLEVVDYSPAAAETVARYFFGQSFIPAKDYRGGPFYAYFYGLHSCRSDYILHLDSDMLLGGLSQTWIAEAIALLETNQDILICSPLPGPPHPDQVLIDQPDPVRIENYSFVFRVMSTRIFMINKTAFQKNKIQLKRPAPSNILKALIKGQPPYALPEQLIGDYMAKYALKRVDFLGKAAGLWSLHPPYRTSGFYEHLPEIIKRVERNDLPEGQLGFYDLTDEVCDWTEARERLRNNRWWNKWI